MKYVYVLLTSTILQLHCVLHGTLPPNYIDSTLTIFLMRELYMYMYVRVSELG